MKNRLIILLSFLLACQPDVSEVPFRVEFKVAALEIAMLEQEHKSIHLLAGEVQELLEDFTTQSDLELQAKGDAIRLLNLIQKDYYNPNDFEELTLLKEDLLLLFNSNTYKDNHLDALWRYGNALLTATSTARDPLMDLYEWKEFEMQVDNMEIGWDLLERQQPSMALLRYNNDKVPLQVALMDQLRNAMKEFIRSVEDGISTTDELCDKADILRASYARYLEMLVNIDLESSSENALE